MTAPGNAVARAQSGVFISDATCNSGGTVLGTAGPVLNSSVTLSSSNSSSTVTCTVTLYNNSNISYYYDDMVYDTSDVNFYSNTNIVPSVDISQGDEIESQDTLVLHVTFGYDSGVTPSSSINTLTSYINFSFSDSTAPPDVKLVDAVLALVNGKTHTNGLYTITPAGASGCTYTLAYDGKYDTLYTNYGTDDNNLRYVGANPCNYVSLGGETWRIIGVMNGMGSQPLVKLINNAYYDNGTATALGKNNINTWLSTTLYTSMSSLSITSNSMVESVAWYNGGPSAYNNTAKAFYDSEKQTTTSTAKIGLINVSDYGFATDNISSCRSTQLSTWSSPATCVTNHNWLNINSQDNAWTISAVGGRKTMYRLNQAGNPYPTQTNQTGLIKAVIYLKNSVLVDSGNGDANTPYTLKIKSSS